MSQEQRTPEWYAQRTGKFTSSRIHELMGIKGLGKTGETYAFEMAVEIAEGKDFSDDFISFDMQRGIETEPLAFEKFSELKQMDFIEVHKCGFFELNKNTGGSPDGLVGLNGVLEIKCPKPNKFFRLVCDNVIDPGYVDQMQHQMFVTGREVAHFFNYCIYNGEPRWHEIIVPRDQSRIDIMVERIDQAVSLRDDFVSEIISKRQYPIYLPHQGFNQAA